MKKAILFSSILALAGCFSESDSASDNQSEKTLFNVQLDATNSSYTVMQLKDGSWKQLNNSSQIIQMDSNFPQLNLIQICEDTIIEHRLTIDKDLDINQYWCNWLTYNSSENSPELVIVEPTSNDYEIVSAASTGSSNVDYEFGNAILYYNDSEEIHTIAALVKRISDKKVFLFKKSGFEFSNRSTINIDFDSEQLFETKTIDTPNTGNADDYTTAAVLEESLILPLSDYESDRRVHYLIPHQLTTNSSYLIETFDYFSKGRVTNHVREVGISGPGLEALPILSNDDIQVSQDKTEITMPDLSKFHEGYTETKRTLLLHSISGTAHIIEIGPNRLRNTIKLNELSLLPNFPSDFLALNYTSTSVEVLMDNGNQPGIGASFIHIKNQ